ncbi:MAG: iron-sulfur cluster assembly protein [Pseudomonadota bacterium]|nr:iron-sulfur cluster assembly protein [Pseudomonadota bacterium]
MHREETRPAVTPRIEEIEAQLRKVADPCSLRAQRRLDILSMGLITDLQVDGSSVSMKLVLTDPTCLFGGEIIEGIKTAVGQMPGVEHVEVGFDTEEIWTPDRLSPEAAKTFWPKRPADRQRH